VLPRRTAAMKIVWFGLVHYERGAFEFTVRRKMEEELSNGPFFFGWRLYDGELSNFREGHVFFAFFRERMFVSVNFFN
jgi:hypothetical protein